MTSRWLLWKAPPQAGRVWDIPNEVYEAAFLGERTPPIAASIMAASMMEAERIRKDFLAKTVAGLCEGCKQKLRDAGCSLEPDYSDVLPGKENPDEPT